MQSDTARIADGLKEAANTGNMIQANEEAFFDNWAQINLN